MSGAGQAPHQHGITPAEPCQALPCPAGARAGDSPLWSIASRRSLDEAVPRPQCLLEASAGSVPAWASSYVTAASLKARRCFWPCWAHAAPRGGREAGIPHHSLRGVARPPASTPQQGGSCSGPASVSSSCRRVLTPAQGLCLGQQAGSAALPPLSGQHPAASLPGCFVAFGRGQQGPQPRQCPAQERL